MIVFKFLDAGAVAPFTGFRWPGPGVWVTAPEDRPEVWIHACRARDVAHWIAEELWRVELDHPLHEARYQIASPRGRLVSRVAAWDRTAAREYAGACALRARDLALPRLADGPREALARAGDLEAISAAAGAAGPDLAAAYLADAARYALRADAATTSYIAAALASVVGDGLGAFEAERAWQARWLGARLGLDAAPEA